MHRDIQSEESVIERCERGGAPRAAPLFGEEASEVRCDFVSVELENLQRFVV